MIGTDRRLRAASAIVCVLGLAVGPARASAAERDEAAARTLFAEGRRLAAAGNYAEACPKFEDSLRLDAGIGTTFNLADCLEHIGRVASAWARFLDVAAATKLAGQPEREKVARERAAALEPRLARLVIQVASPVPGLAVARDQAEVTRSSWGVALPIDPGVHAIKATAPGRKPWLSSVTVPEGTAATVSLSVPVLEALPTPPAPPPAVPAATVTAAAPAASLPPQRQLSVAVVMTGTIALVGLAASVYFGLEFRRENSDAMLLCRPTECASTDDFNRHASLVEEASRDRTLAFVSGAVGGAALLTTAYLWWLSVQADPAKKTAPRAAFFRPRLGARTAGGDLTFDW